MESLTVTQALTVTGPEITLNDVQASTVTIHGEEGSVTQNIEGAVSTTAADSSAIFYFNQNAGTSITLNFSNEGCIDTYRVNFGNKTAALTFSVELTENQLNTLKESVRHDLSYTLISANESGECWNREVLGDAVLQDVESLKGLTLTNLGVLIVKDNKYYTMANSENKSLDPDAYCVAANEVDVSQYVGSSSSLGYYAIFMDDRAKKITFEVKAPEPATTTLSLLALAALAARRKRH